MMITRRGWRSGMAVAMLIAALLPGPAHAQATGSIAGIITDQSGAVLPGVTIEAMNAATAQVRGAVTGSDGYFTIPLLQPGQYDVKATLAGFKPTRSEGATVSVGDTTRVDMKLSVGGVSENVTVSGETPLIETAHATLGITIDQQKVVELPLNGRNFTQLGTLIPGVVAPPPASAAPPVMRRPAGSARRPRGSASTACATSRTTSCSTARATTTRSTPAS